MLVDLPHRGIAWARRNQSEKFPAGWLISVPSPLRVLACLGWRVGASVCRESARLGLDMCPWPRVRRFFLFFWERDCF